jgi:hypothetical protein
VVGYLNGMGLDGWTCIELVKWSFVGCLDLGCARDPVIAMLEHRATRRGRHYNIHLSYACGYGISNLLNYTSLALGMKGL